MPHTVMGRPGLWPLARVYFTPYHPPPPILSRCPHLCGEEGGPSGNVNAQGAAFPVDMMSQLRGDSHLPMDGAHTGRKVAKVHGADRLDCSAEAAEMMSQIRTDPEADMFSADGHKSRSAGSIREPFFRSWAWGFQCEGKCHYRATPARKQCAF